MVPTRASPKCENCQKCARD
jgi:hypothetical protein